MVLLMFVSYRCSFFTSSSSSSSSTCCCLLTTTTTTTRQLLTTSTTSKCNITSRTTRKRWQSTGSSTTTPIMRTSYQVLLVRERLALTTLHPVSSSSYHANQQKQQPYTFQQEQRSYLSSKSTNSTSSIVLQNNESKKKNNKEEDGIILYKRNKERSWRPQLLSSLSIFNTVYWCFYNYHTLPDLALKGEIEISFVQTFMGMFGLGSGLLMIGLSTIYPLHLISEIKMMSSRSLEIKTFDLPFIVPSQHEKGILYPRGSIQIVNSADRTKILENGSSISNYDGHLILSKPDSKWFGYVLHSHPTEFINDRLLTSLLLDTNNIDIYPNNNNNNNNKEVENTTKKQQQLSKNIRPISNHSKVYKSSHQRKPTPSRRIVKKRNIPTT